MAQLLPLRRHRTARRQLRHPRDHGRARGTRAAHPDPAVRLTGHLGQRPDAWDLELSLDVTFTDIDTNYRLTPHNGVLIHVERPADDTADATLTVTKGRMLGLLAGDTSSPGIDIAGDTDVLELLLSVLDKGDPDFNIATP